MTPRLQTRRPRDVERPRGTGRIRFLASLGVLAFAGVAVTAAAVTDSTVAVLSPVGATFDVAFADAAGTLIPEGTVYVVPDSEITGVVRPLDTPVAGQDATFPLRIVNNSTGSLGGHVQVTFQSASTANAVDVFSKLQMRVIDPASPSTPLLPWTAATATPTFAIDLDAAAARKRTLQVQVRLVASDQIDARYYGAPVGIGVTIRGESS